MFLTQTFKILYINFGVCILFFPFELFHQLQNKLFLDESQRQVPNYWEYGRLLEIFHKVLAIFWITQIIASREKRADLKLWLMCAQSPQIFTQASFRGQLSVFRKMIIKLRRLDFNIDIGHVKFNMESLRWWTLVFEPADPLDCPSYIGLYGIGWAYYSKIASFLLRMGLLQIHLPFHEAASSAVWPLYVLLLQINSPHRASFSCLCFREIPLLASQLLAIGFFNWGRLLGCKSSCLRWHIPAFWTLVATLDFLDTELVLRLLQLVVSYSFEFVCFQGKLDSIWVNFFYIFGIRVIFHLLLCDVLFRSRLIL